MVMADGGSAIVGDLPGYGEDAYFSDDAAYYADDQDYQDDTSVVTPASHNDEAIGRTRSAATRTPTRTASARSASTQQPASNYAPISANEMQPVSHQVMMSDMSGHGMSMSHTVSGDCGCGTSACGGGTSCGSACQPTARQHRKICDVFDRCGGNTWMNMETLLWFVQGRDTPPLITTSDAGTLPILGGPGNTQTVFGNDIEGDMSVGFRGDAGVWLSDNIGVGGRFWIIDSNGEDFSARGNGSDRSIGRSFFNTEGPFGEDALLVALDGVFQGEIEAESELDMLGAEAYARMKIGCSKNARLNLIGGYSHFRIDDSLTINSTTINTISTGGNPIGTTRRFTDMFDTENEFNGGQIGFDLVMNRGRWMVSSLTKVHLGNMSQSASIRGGNTRQIPGGPLSSLNGGVLAPVTAINADEDVFSFIPEANFKMAYRFRPNVLLSVGYSFMYFDNVALTGDVINRNVARSSIGSGAASVTPAFDMDDSSLWVQGIDLGFVIDF